MNDEWPENAWLLLHEAKSRWGRQTSPRQVEYTRANLAAERERKLVEALKRLLAPHEFETCRYDHHGYCQEHYLEADCCVAKAHATLKELGYE